MKDPAKIPITSTTQDHLDIETITNDLVVLKDGSAALVLEVSAINFGLLSEDEQEATIYAYGQLLNSLTFPIQIIIASKQKDISDYLELLNQQLQKTTSPLIRDQLVKYQEFVRSVVRQGNVLDKKFYISLPFSFLELGIASSLKSVSKRQKAPSRPIPDIVSRATTVLSPKRDHLVRLLARIGLISRQLTTPELIQLFFDFYNRGHLGLKVNLP